MLLSSCVVWEGVCQVSGGQGAASPQLWLGGSRDASAGPFTWILPAVSHHPDLGSDYCDSFIQTLSARRQTA